MQNIMKKIISIVFVLGLFLVGVQNVSAYTPGYVSANATNITQTSAKLNGIFNPSGLNTNAWFVLYLDDTQLNSQNIGSGLDDVTMTPYNLSGLTPNTTYKFRIIANNATGTTWGPWISFTTTENIVTPPTLDPTPRIAGWGR